MEQNTEDVSTSYDRAADEYVARIYDELDHKPQDCELLVAALIFLPANRIPGN